MGNGHMRTLSPLNRMTNRQDTAKNINFPQTTYADGKYCNGNVCPSKSVVILHPLRCKIEDKLSVQSECRMFIVQFPRMLCYVISSLRWSCGIKLDFAVSKESLPGWPRSVCVVSK